MITTEPSAFVVVAGSAMAGSGELASLRRTAVADACVRFRAANGELLDLAGEPLARLGCWRSGPDDNAADAATHRWLQSVFLGLLENGSVYERDGDWYLRTRVYVEENESRLSELSGWSPNAVAGQATALGRVDGAEFDAPMLTGAATLTIFTEFPEAIGEAAFVAVSPYHPGVEEWIGDEGANDRRLRRARAVVGHGADELDPTFIRTDAAAVVPGAAHVLPVVVRSYVHARFGPVAVLGVPSASAGDAAVAERLGDPKGSGWQIASKPVTPRPAARFRSEDVPISGDGGSGPLVPLLRCERCGDVPFPAEPIVDAPSAVAVPCPACGGTAAHDARRLALGPPRAWAAMRAGLPTLSVRTAGDHDILVERTIAKAARDAGDERIPADGEPHGPLLLVGDVVTDEPVSVDDLLGRVGIDALRFAALYAAAPARPIRWNDEVARHCAGFLDRLWGFAQPRLEAATIPEEPSIDGSQRAHRLLGKWCRIAVERVTENLAAAETHRATRNVMLLLERIEDFEARAAEGANELSGTDRDAVAFALIVLVQLVAPLAPHLAQELWETAGRPGLVADEPWPTVDAAERRLELAGSGGRPS